MKKIVLINLVLILCTAIQAQIIKDWNQDLDYLIEKYNQLYPDFYKHVDSIEFNQIVASVKESLTENNQDKNILGLFKIHAFLNDAHSIPMIFHPCYNLHSYPIKIFRFNDGWYIIDAKENYTNLIGSKIIAIGEIPIEKIYEKLPEIISFENEYGKLDRFDMAGLCAEWLVNEGIASNIDSAEFVLQKPGKENLYQYINSVDMAERFRWAYIDKIDKDSYFAFNNSRADKYWYNYNKSSKNLYVQFNSVDNQEDYTIEDFVNDLQKLTNRKKPNKFILDLRNNYGGNDKFLGPFLQLLKENKNINQYGKLYVLIGRHTFSSGLLFAWKLRMQTEAIFVGEPAGQGPVFNANAEFVYLPNSKIGFTISKTSTARTQPLWPFHLQNTLEPDFSVNYSIDDFTEKSDPCLDFVINHKVQKSETKEHLSSIDGRYKLSDYHLVKLVNNQSGAKMIITDFIESSLFSVEKQLIYNESKNSLNSLNNDFTLSIKGETLSLCYNGDCKNIDKLRAQEQLLFEAIHTGNYQKALKALKENPDYYKNNFTRLEYFLTLTAYKLLQNEQMDISLKYFEFIVNLYPDSWNAYDSYGEALAKTGRVEEAILQYQKSIDLNPDNQNGKDWLKKLEAN